MDQQLQWNLLHVFKIPDVFISSIFLACSLAPPSLTTAVRCIARCLFEDSFLLAQWSIPRSLPRSPMSRSFTRHRCRFPPPAIASLHLRSLPPPVIAHLHLPSLSSTCNRFPPTAIALLPACDRFPPPAIAPLHLPRARSFPSTCDRFPSPAPSTCDRFPPPTIASLHLRSLPSTLHLRSLPSTCDRSLPPAIASLHFRSLPCIFLHQRLLPSTCSWRLGDLPRRLRRLTVRCLGSSSRGP
jgi:hypothetical protein